MESYQLRVTYADGLTDEIPLSSNVFTIGRDEDQNLVLDDRTVSRRHAKLLLTNRGWVIMNMGSSNRTVVDGEPLESGEIRARKLSNGTTIRIGETSIRFQAVVYDDDPTAYAEMQRYLREGTSASAAAPAVTEAAVPVLPTTPQIEADAALRPRATLSDDADFDLAGLGGRRSARGRDNAPVSATGSADSADSAGAAALGTWRLYIALPGQPQQTRILSGSLFTVGSGSTNDLMLDHPSVSPRHAELKQIDTGWRVRDAFSEHGTLVNGERLDKLTTHRLADGDVIKLGEVEIRARLERWWIEIKRESIGEEPVEIARSPFRIGCDSGNDLELQDPRASAFHAQLVLEQGILRLVDLGDGSYVNMKFVKGTNSDPLYNGAIIQIGDTQLTTRLGTPARTGTRPLAAPTPTPAATSAATKPEPELEPTLPAEPPPLPALPPAPVLPAAPALPPKPEPQRNLAGEAAEHISRLPVWTYWRLRATRSVVTWVGTTFGLVSLQRWFSRWFGYIPGPLARTDDIDVWMEATDPARLRKAREGKARLDEPATEASPSEVVLVSQSGTAPATEPAGEATANSAVDARTIAIIHSGQIVEAVVMSEEAAAKKVAQENAQIVVGQAIMEFTPDVLTVDPGLTASGVISVINRSKVVDRITFAVAGLPESWVTITPKFVSLFPDERGEAQVQIHPPRNFSSRAGPHFFQVIGYSDKRREKALINAALIITPFYEFRADLRPAQQQSWRQAYYTLGITNTGNREQGYRLEGRDDEELLTFDFGKAREALAPGDAQQTRVKVRVSRLHWFGMARTFLFNLSAAPEDGALPPQQVIGRIVQQPLLTIWTILAILLLLLLCIAPLLLRLLTGTPSTPTPTTQATVDVIAIVTPSLTPDLPTATIELIPTPTDTPAPTSEPAPTNPPLPTDIPAPTFASTATLTPTAAPTPLPGDLVGFPGQPLTIEAFGPPNMPFLISFGDRVVGGGQVGRDGRYRVVLTIGGEQSGVYTLTVQERGGKLVLLKRTVYVPPTTPTPVPSRR
ncbi:MAG TPA: FHA domain-containing protein [Roseiflexaceae bacterium]|nr:FHA domain-containing protein [Roseiflexaceae bacterium]